MSDTAPAIRVKRLSKVLGDRVVLDDVSFDVAEGQTVALLGANGAGKTTLLRCLASLLRPTAGEVRWFGRPAADSPAARRLIGMVAHESRLYPHLTLKENLVFSARMYDLARPARRADELLQKIGLEPYAHHRPRRISNGMRQRLAVARALVHDPPILLLDEPFAGLDPEATNWLGGLLLQFRARQRTVCFTTHDDRHVGRLADRVLRLQFGRIEQYALQRHAALRKRAPTPCAA